MSDWNVLLPERLNREVAELTPGERKSLYLALKKLAADPRAGSSAEPVTGAELRRCLTAPAADTGGVVTVLYRVIPDTRTVAIIWLVAGP
ncbi:hypothetical protein LG634_13025 [Streptomyces bambusae]|uniref:hypothetical protein n=1 Tax=Streptomyces bambusae TaxID=1550616 RepID=UPI001CFCFA85|nr:hypothetical protein [Streptomyces bambusae]MCB5165755.1 hypothetical protein [Streptomyces bambusae]